MKKVEITLFFDEEKLEALEYSLRKEKTTVKKKLDEVLAMLYEQTVPEAVRVFHFLIKPAGLHQNGWANIDWR